MRKGLPAADSWSSAPRQRSRGQHHRHRKIVHAFGEVEQELEACRVGQIGVVDRDQERSYVAEVDAEPVEAMNDVERGAGHRPPGGGVEQQGRLGRGVREQQVALACIGAGHAALEQLQHHAQAELLLAAPSRTGQHLDRVLGGLRPDSCQGGALTEAGRALYQEDRSTTGARPSHGRSRTLEQRLALDQPRGYFVREGESFQARTCVPE
jgi:hypothetical protein